MATSKVFVAAVVALVAAVAVFAFVRVLARATTTVYKFASVSGGEGSSNAVAVRGGKVVEIGRFGDLSSLGRAVTAFDGLVAYPGFSDCVNLASSSLALSADAIVAPEAWPKAGGEWPSVRGKALFDVVLATAARDAADPTKASSLFFAFGWHEPLHGELTRKELESVFATRPVVVMARSCTRFVANDAAARMLGLSSTPAASTGVYRGAAAIEIARRLGRTMRRDRFERGAALLADHLTSVGVTAVRDVTTSGATVRWAQGAFGGSPFSVEYSIDPMPIIADVGFERAGRVITAELDVPRSGAVGWTETPVAMLRLDGGFSEGKQQSKSRPAASGTWAWNPEQTDVMCKLFLERGYGVRYETNGDFALETALSQLHRRAFEGVAPADPAGVEILAVESDGLLSASRAVEVAARVSFDCGFEGENAAPLAAFAGPDDVVGLHSNCPSGGAGPPNPLGLVKRASERSGSQRVARKTAASFATSVVRRGDPANFALLDKDPSTSATPGGVRAVMFEGVVHTPTRAWITGDVDLLDPGVSNGAGDDRTVTASDIGDAFVVSMSASAPAFDARAKST